MRFVNRTGGTIAIQIINSETGNVVNDVAYVANGQTLDGTIRTTKRGSSAEREHRGIVCLVGRAEDKHQPYDLLATDGAPAIRPLNGAHPLALRFTAMSIPAVGTEFAVEIANEAEIERMREEARELFGRDIHIRAKIGPLEFGTTSLGCPIEAVDDPVLSGRFNRFPQKPGHVLLVGYFKAVA